MASRLSLRLYIFVGVFVLVLLITVLVISSGSSVGSAETSIIPAGVAVNRAIDAAMHGGIYGGLVGQPTEIRGQVMTYGEALRFVDGRPPDPNSLRGKMSDNAVWLIIFRGNVVEHVPGAPGDPAKGVPDIPPKDVTHTQMAVILDANTAESIEMTMISPQRVLPVNSLSVLSLPSGPQLPTPTKAPIKTTAPFATLTPAPPHP